MTGETLELYKFCQKAENCALHGQPLTPVNVVSPDGVLVPTPELRSDRRSRGLGVDISWVGTQVEVESSKKQDERVLELQTREWKCGNVESRMLKRMFAKRVFE